MIITAKYASTCCACHAAIPAGARHVACAAPASGSRRAPRLESASRASSRFPTSAPEVGAHQISGRRTGRSDRRYEIGQTIHAPRVSTPGGGPDQRYYTVIASALSAPCEDMDQYEWTETAWVRAATDAEAAPLAATITARDARASELAALRAEFAAGRRLSEEDAQTVASEQSADAVEIVAGVHGSGREWIAFADAEHVVWVHGGHYDDYRVSATWLPRTPALESRVRTLAAK